MADLRIVDAPVLLQESITDDVKIPTGGLGNFSIRLGDIVWYVVAKEQLANKNYVDLSSKGVKDSLDVHIADKANPHQVTKAQVGLGNVDNTADIDKPVSNATKSAITTATTDMATKNYVNQQDNLKADKSTTLSGYGITDAYTKDEINTSISLKADTSYVDGKSGDLTTLTTTDKSSLVKAVNEVYDKTAFFYATVADMVADTKLKVGKAVITHGYYTPNDGGGARYLIKDTATDYSIPVANGLHALLSDSFDIRKFGIRNNATLDQTTEIQRMVNYADSRIYEIDFLNYSLMTPSIVHWTTGRGSIIKGMGFKKPHHLKNLTIANDKTVQLVQGTSPIMFLADDPNGSGLFKLSNIKFDPYVSNFKINNGEGDGMMFGFLVEWHPNANQTYPSSTRFVTGYDLEFDNVEFLSPAISYNLACAGFFTRNLKANNVRGDYWGIMLVHHTYNLDANNVNGVFRDDLHKPSGRLLVTNLIHEEAEIADAGIITRNNISVKNSSCFKKTNNSVHVVYKCHRIGTITINNVLFEQNIGKHQFYSGETTDIITRLTIKNLTMQNFINFYNNGLTCRVDNFNAKNIDTSVGFLLTDSNNGSFGTVVIDKVRVLKTAIAITPITIDNLTVMNIDQCDDIAYGIIRNNKIIVTNALLKNITCNQPKLFDCAFTNLEIDNLKTVYMGQLNYFIGNSSQSASSVVIKNSSIYADVYNAYGMFYSHDAIYSATDTLTLVNTDITNTYANLNASATVSVKNCKITRVYTYDPPSIPANSSITTTQTIRGAMVGDTVVASFSIYDANIDVSAVVSANNTIIVKFKNNTASAIDLASGTLTVKIV